jgi:hypothetical protein
MAFFLFTLFYTLAPKGDRNLKLLIPLAIFARLLFIWSSCMYFMFCCLRAS